jgi:hypothetical protein
MATILRAPPGDVLARPSAAFMRARRSSHGRSCRSLGRHLPRPSYRVVSGWRRRRFHWCKRWRDHSPGGVGDARTSHRLINTRRTAGTRRKRNFRVPKERGCDSKKSELARNMGAHSTSARCQMARPVPPMLTSHSGMNGPGPKRAGAVFSLRACTHLMCSSRSTGCGQEESAGMTARTGKAKSPVGGSEPGSFLCAEHDRQLGGVSPLSSLMVAKD